jgi:hypothetical protein
VTGGLYLQRLPVQEGSRPIESNLSTSFGGRESTSSFSYTSIAFRVAIRQGGTANEGTRLYDIVERTETYFIEILFKSRRYDFYIRESLPSVAFFKRGNTICDKSCCRRGLADATSSTSQSAERCYREQHVSHEVL